MLPFASSLELNLRSWAQDERLLFRRWTADNSVSPVHARFERFCGRFAARILSTPAAAFTLSHPPFARVIHRALRTRSPMTFRRPWHSHRPGRHSLSPLVHNPLWRWEPARASPTWLRRDACSISILHGDVRSKSSGIGGRTRFDHFDALSLPVTIDPSP